VMEREYVRIKVYDYASRRTKNRFSKFEDRVHRIEIINRKNNEVLSGDGFVKGEPMTYFGIDTLGDNEVWSRAWEGWIPDDEYEIVD